MTNIERNTALSLGCIFSFRMLGLFMILPVFTFYAYQLKGTTPILIGVALGIYGLVQACLQIPFGMLSDHIGRKPVIAFGLGLYAGWREINVELDDIDDISSDITFEGAYAGLQFHF